MLKSKYLKSGFAFIVMISLLYMYSCLDDKYDFNKISTDILLKPKVNAPLAFGSISIKSILKEFDINQAIKEDSDKSLYFTYSDRIVSSRASEFFDIPDQNFNIQTINPNISNSNWISFQTQETLNFHKETKKTFIFSADERPDSIFIRSSVLRINIKSSFKAPGTLKISAPTIFTEDDIPFSADIPASNTSGNFDQSVNINLNNAKIILDNNFDPEISVLPLILDFSLNNPDVEIEPDTKCSISISLRNIQFSALFGYLGNHELMKRDNQLRLNLFDVDNIDKGKIRFFNPSLLFDISNSYGLPIYVELYDFSSYSERYSNTIPIYFTSGNPFEIHASTQPGSFAKTEIIFDKNNSNLDEAIDNEVNLLTFKSNSNTNPDNFKIHNNFVTDNSRLIIDFIIKLPLWVKATDVILKDTIDFDLEKIILDGVGKFIDYLKISIDADNGIPLESELQVYLTDENYVQIDSIFNGDNNHFQPAKTDSDGNLISKTSISHKTEFSGDKINNFKNIKFAIISVKVNTPETEQNRYIKFFSEYSIDYKIKLKADLTIDSKDL